MKVCNHAAKNPKRLRCYRDRGDLQAPNEAAAEGTKVTRRVFLKIKGGRHGEGGRY